MIPFTQVNQVEYRPNGQQVFGPLSLSVAGGERISIVGANGTGKSTLLRFLLGLQIPSVGIISPPSDDVRARYVPQDYRAALFPWLTVHQNVMIDPALQTQGDHNATVLVQRILDRLRLHIDDGSPIYHCSGGEQQGLVLARCLASEPDLLAIDEPTSAIDYGRKSIFVELFGEFVHEHENAATICTTHDFVEACLLADQVYAFDGRSGVLREVATIGLSWPRNRRQEYEPMVQKALRQIEEVILKV